MELSSQFRCNGSDGYLAWLDNTLAIRETANPMLDGADYDFRVFENPADLHALVELKNRANNRSRVVAGYCWKWPSKKDPKAWDIELPQFDYQRRWNLDKDGSLWIVAPDSVEQVGCIHTCQGLELDYVGVIIGPDLAYRDGCIVADATRRASSDQSVRGLKSMVKAEPERARALADAIVKNTYRTLMTRGMKGCYVYCTDVPLAAYLRSRLKVASANGDANRVQAVATPTNSAKQSVVPLRKVTQREREAGVIAAPIIDLTFAADAMSHAQALEDGAEDWVALPDWVRPQPGLFVAQVVGESMDQHIPDGAWCLFRAHRSRLLGSKAVVQPQSSATERLVWRHARTMHVSEKMPARDGGWLDERVTLQPHSDLDRLQPIEISLPNGGGGLSVAAEMLTVLATGGE